MISSVPDPGERRIAVRVTRDAERQLRGGHPWLFDGSITSLSHEGRAGDLAVVFDHDRKFVAIGLFDPASPIRVRILAQGAPTPIDNEFWRDRIAKAAALRSGLLADGVTTGYRLVNGENDGMGGLIADLYDRVLVLKLYSAAWLPHLATVLPHLQQAAGTDTVVLRMSRLVQRQPTFGLTDGLTIIGDPVDAPVLFTELGLWFEADVVHGQKTGYFLDQRHNRALVGGLSAGGRVLDVFACTGGFSVHAAAGGAREVVSTDLSPQALATAAANMDHNRDLEAVARCRHRSVRGDAFAVMGDLAGQGERFDVVVVDPPSFASRQSDVARALHSYGKLTELALPLLASGGVLVQASCSSRVPAVEFFATIRSVAASADRGLDEIAITGHDIDHPVGFAEGEYLKTLFARVD